MSNLLSQDQSALKMLFTEDIYLVHEETKEAPAPIIEREIIAEADVRIPLEIKVPVAGKIQPELKGPDITAQPEVPNAFADFEYLGENNKYFLVLHDDRIHTRINPVHQEMLMKVMAAKKLELRDLAIVNISRYPGVKFDALKSFFSCTRILMFGVNPSDFGFGTLKLNQEKSAGSVRILATYSLEDMRNNAEKKREFWNVMKSF